MVFEVGYRMLAVLQLLDGSKQKHSLDRHTTTSVLQWPKLYEISGFRPDIDQLFALLGCNAEYFGIFHRRFGNGMLCQIYDKTTHTYKNQEEERPGLSWFTYNISH
jgi:hypothetical protein